jgi:hypothetical protein
VKVPEVNASAVELPHRRAKRYINNMRTPKYVEIAGMVRPSYVTSFWILGVILVIRTSINIRRDDGAKALIHIAET